MSREKPKESVLTGFAKRFSDLAEGRTNKDVGDQIGVDDETVRVWKEGKNLPDGVGLLKIREGLRCGIDYLLTGEEDSCLPSKWNFSERARQEYKLLTRIVSGANEAARMQDPDWLVNILQWAIKKLEELPAASPAAPKKIKGRSV